MTTPTSLIARILLPAVALALTAFGVSGRPLDEVVASKLLRVAVYEDNSPFSFRANGTMTGIDVDIATALANALGVEVELIPRMQGEDVDTDLRANVWKGPLLGGPVGDVMMHVPLDRELALRNREAVLANPYFEQRIALGYDPAKIGPEISFDVFKREKVGVRLGSVADYFVMFADGGALRNNVLHFIKPSDGVKRFLDKEMAAILGVRSELEGLLHEAGAKAPFAEPPMPGIIRSRWILGLAVKDNSRDLGYALGAALDKMKQSGALAAICSRYGVTYAPPPLQ